MLIWNIWSNPNKNWACLVFVCVCTGRIRNDVNWERQEVWEKGKDGKSKTEHAQQGNSCQSVSVTQWIFVQLDRKTKKQRKVTQCRLINPGVHLERVLKFTCIHLKLSFSLDIDIIGIVLKYQSTILTGRYRTINIVKAIVRCFFQII